MSNKIKMAIAIGSALCVGLLAGYVLGTLGKRALTHSFEREQSRAREAESSLNQVQEECEKKAKSARAGRHVMLTKEQLLRTIIELSASNFGLASQHLGSARTELKAAQKRLPKRNADKARELFDKIGGAQTMAMRLDPMTKIIVEKILAEVHRLPGGR